MEQTVYGSSTLLGVMREDKNMQPPARYWLDMFPTAINFDTEEIDFSKLTGTRKLAPLVVPTAQGVPIYTNAERRSVVRPAYVKPKDAVTATRMMRRVAGMGELGSNDRALSPAQRYAAIVADILREHRFSIERRWEWLASEAIQNGRVTLEDDRYPLTVVDFERDAAHTATLTAGNFWGDAGVSILESVEGFRKIVRDAAFGGVTNRMTIGSDVWDVMRKDQEIRELLNTNYRLNSGAELNMGLRDPLEPGLEVERVGKLSANLEVYVYSDYYQDEAGATVPFMSTKDIVLTGSNIQGVKCFGAIQDISANLQSLAIFPKMWPEQDPSATFIMSQSAPLMVPVNPNNTFKATVLA